VGQRTAQTTIPALLRQYRVLLAVLALLVLGIAGLAATPGGRAEIVRSVTRESEPFVAMYFADPPVRTAGQQISVGFVVEQHEVAAEPYPYLIVVRSGSGAELASVEGTADPTPDRPAQVSRDVALPVGSTWATIDVTLSGRSESLYVRNPAPAPGARS
jgi:hypothetical protein